MIFLVVLFLIKTTSIFKNTETYQKAGQENGLTLDSTITIEDLVNNDTDKDGILDWEESLYGTDPTKKETTAGTSDKVTIQKIKAQQVRSGDATYTGNASVGAGTENLTETDKFSRELFATIVASNQNGIIDENAIEALSTSLAEKIKNPVVRRVFTVADIKISPDDSAKAVKTYFDTMNSTQAKYPIKESVTSVLQKFVLDENNVDSSVLVKLDESINQTQNIINGILKINVPQSLVTLHLDLLNAGERVMENVIDMQLFDADPIISMGGMSKYIENMTLFNSTFMALANAISKKLPQ